MYNQLFFLPLPPGSFYAIGSGMTSSVYSKKTSSVAARDHLENRVLLEIFENFLKKMAVARTLLVKIRKFFVRMDNRPSRFFWAPNRKNPFWTVRTLPIVTQNVNIGYFANLMLT